MEDVGGSRRARQAAAQFGSCVRHMDDGRLLERFHPPSSRWLLPSKQQRGVKLGDQCAGQLLSYLSALPLLPHRLLRSMATIASPQLGQTAGRMLCHAPVWLRTWPRHLPLRGHLHLFCRFMSYADEINVISQEGAKTRVTAYSSEAITLNGAAVFRGVPLLLLPRHHVVLKRDAVLSAESVRSVLSLLTPRPDMLILAGSAFATDRAAARRYRQASGKAPEEPASPLDDLSLVDLGIVLEKLELKHAASLWNVMNEEDRSVVAIFLPEPASLSMAEWAKQTARLPDPTES